MWLQWEAKSLLSASVYPCQEVGRNKSYQLFRGDQKEEFKVGIQTLRQRSISFLKIFICRDTCPEIT